MSDAEEVKISLKVMTNKDKTKVLFAESDGHFVDVLLSFLTLPMGRIVRAMEKHYGDEAPIIGCFNTLYKSIANLDSSHVSTEVAKVLLNPTSSFDIYCRSLKLYIDDLHSEPECFHCENCPSNRLWIQSILYDKTSCKICGSPMKRDLAKKPSLDERSGGVFTLDTATFIITDDLQIVPNAVGLVQTISTLDISGTSNAELMDVTLGLADVIELLRASMISQTPLSHLLLKQTRKLKPEVSLTDQMEEEENPESKKVILKVTVQKSTNRLLFAQAKEDFIDFLFSLLTIPLGGVECLLEGNTSIKTIDNLFRSACDLIDDEHFKTPDMINWLIEPLLPHGYVSNNQILPLIEDRLPLDYYKKLSLFYSENFARGKGKYVKGSRLYQVLDDLTVTPFCFSSIICNLNSQRIPVSDLKEMEVEIGLEEALRILKASLTSNSALTNALFNHIQPKQETLEFSESHFI